MSGNTSLSITIITLGNYKVLSDCLDSIYRYNAKLDLEIILVANNVNDKFLKEIKRNYPYVIIFETKGVKGFSENQNLALRKATKEFVCVLNDDVIFVDDSLTRMVTILVDNKDISFISPKILNLDGTNQYYPELKNISITLFIKNLIFIKEKKINYKIISNMIDNSSGMIQIFSLSGACFVARNNILNELNYFDEDYFFTPEDIDLAIRAIKKGYRIYMYTDSKVFHINGNSSKELSSILLSCGWSGIYLLVRKHYGFINEIVLRIISFIMSIVKIFYSILANNSKSKKRIEYYKMLLTYSLRKMDPREVFIKLNKAG